MPPGQVLLRFLLLAATMVFTLRFQVRINVVLTFSLPGLAANSDSDLSSLVQV
jgi:hypothetical protein